MSGDHPHAIDEPAAGPDWTPLPSLRPQPKGSVLMAAMLGLANALGMEPKTEPSEMVQPAEPIRDGLDLDFGSLPPLD